MFAATKRPPGCATIMTRPSSEVCSFTEAASNSTRWAAAGTPNAVTTRKVNNVAAFSIDDSLNI